MTDRQEKPSKVKACRAISTAASTAYPGVFHRPAPDAHNPPLVNDGVNSSPIHPDFTSPARWNQALSAVREDGLTKKQKGGSQMKKIAAALAVMLALGAYVSYPSAEERIVSISPSALMSDTRSLPVEAFDAV
jgi:hypothetical protein